MCLPEGVGTVMSISNGMCNVRSNGNRTSMLGHV